MNETRRLLWDLIHIGELLGILQHVTGTSRADAACECIRELKEALENLRLVDSAKHAEQLYDPLVKKLEEQIRVNPDTQLMDQADELQASTAYLADKVLQNEANGRSVFVVPRDKFEVEDLLIDPIAVLCSNTTPSFPIPPHAVEDFKEAAECYAIGRSAAAIVFSLRATEAVLRDFYGKVTQAQADEQATWGSLARILGLPVLSCDQAVKSHLGALRKRRNDAMHAGARQSHEWDSDAAQEVMHQCGKVIGAMWQDYAKRTQVSML